MLEINKLSVSYNDKIILKNIDLKINQGDIVSILGASGCGKSTLLFSILGIKDICSGSIIYNGIDITNYEAKKRGFSVAFQNYALFSHLNCYENIVYGIKNKNINSDVDKIIEVLELSAHLDKKISQLSGGQKQRVSLARALCINPKVLLLDEPLSALDGVIKLRIKEFISRINREFNITIIMVTHDPEEALTMSDRVCILNNGEVELFDSPINVIKNNTSKYVNDFIKEVLYKKSENINKVLDV